MYSHVSHQSKFENLSNVRQQTVKEAQARPGAYFISFICDNESDLIASYHHLATTVKRVKKDTAANFL